MFTDAPAHPLERAIQEKPEYYPEGMPESYTELLKWWYGQGTLVDRSGVSMDQTAKKMLIFAPKVWEKMEDDCDNCSVECIELGKGGRDISSDYFLELLDIMVVYSTWYG